MLLIRGTSYSGPIVTRELTFALADDPFALAGKMFVFDVMAFVLPGNAAMKDLQNPFHAEVSARYGHEWLGPRRRRPDRAEAKLASASRLAEANRRAALEQEFENRTRVFLRDATLRSQEPL